MNTWAGTPRPAVVNDSFTSPDDMNESFTTTGPRGQERSGVAA